jgi:hypothetical protein
MAGTTGLEPATSAVTGQRSSRLNYVPARYKKRSAHWWAMCDLNARPSRCKRDALTTELTARTMLAEGCPSVNRGSTPDIFTC